jgi:hypothetical protein
LPETIILVLHLGYISSKISSSLNSGHTFQLPKCGADPGEAEIQVDGLRHPLVFWESYRSVLKSVEDEVSELDCRLIL